MLHNLGKGVEGELSEFDMPVPKGYGCLVPESENGADEVWVAEIARRMVRFDAGEVQAIPVAEVLASLSDCAPANGPILDERVFRKALREAEDVKDCFKC